MAEVVVIGGFGSSPEQMDYIAQRVGDHLGACAVGINLRNASQRQEELAFLIDDTHVVNHSGGMLPTIEAVKTGARPRSVTAIGPPIKDHSHQLMFRGALMHFGWRDAMTEQLEQKFEETHELRNYFVDNYRMIPAIARFDGLDQAAYLLQSNIPTAIGIMEDDGMFRVHTPEVEARAARLRQLGGEVVRLSGGHCRFTSEPETVLDEMSTSPDFYADTASRYHHTMSAISQRAVAASELLRPQLQRIGRRTHSESPLLEKVS